jgi:signal transduction histidine kinase
MRQATTERVHMISRITLPVKLGLLGLVPLTAIAGLVTSRVVEDFEVASSRGIEANEVRRVDSLGQVIEQVDNEILTLNELGANESDVVAQRERSDAAIAALLANPHGSDPETIDRVAKFSARLPALRSVIPSSPSTYRLSGAAVGRTVFAADATALEAMSEDAVSILEATREFDRFTDELQAATKFTNELFVDGTLAADISTLQLLDQFARQQNVEGQVYVALASLPASSRSEATLQVGNGAAQDAQLWRSVIDQLGVTNMVDSFQVVVNGEASKQVEATRQTMASLVPGQPLSLSAADVQEAFVVQAAELQTLRAELSADTIQKVDAVRGDASRSAYVTMALAALFVAIVGALIYLLYVSIRKPLRRVTQRSLEVANVELPAVVAALRLDGDAELPEIQTIFSSTNDDIGQLVDAFNQMSATALELAGEQAISRRAVGDMFMNLGRRNQKLLNRMLHKLDDLQRYERDPVALQALYEVDHLTTRMRRNAESLLILAGAQQTRRFVDPVAAGDIVRASLAEVENFDRVQIVGESGQQIRGEFVADLTHLVAELIENALTFSPPDSIVQVTTRMTQRGYMITVNDDGIGMSPDKLAEANRRIELAAAQEETPSKFLGLFVVGRLAARRSVAVRLYESPSGGIAVRVALPDSALFASGDLETPPDLLTIGQTLAAAEQSAVEAAQAQKPLDVPPTVEAVHVEQNEPVVAADQLLSEPVPPVVRVPAAATQSEVSSIFRRALASVHDVAEPHDPNAASPVPHLPGSLPDPRRPLTSPTGDILTDPQTAPANKFGATTRRPGANLPLTPATTEGPTGATLAAPPGPGRSPDQVRNSLSGFQAGTGHADRREGLPTTDQGTHR